MCGITGIFLPLSTEPVDSGHALDTMTDALTHRGPDGRGTWSNPNAGVHLGHRRLAIIELSDHGHQPMVSPSGRYVIVYNGEVYNHMDLRKELSGTEFRGHSDTETLLAGFDAWGVDATLQRIVGMFAFAVWDKQENMLVLARDRLGEKPLYYGHLQDGTFLFASEIKGVTAHPHFQGRIDPVALRAFLRYGNVPSPLCIWKGLHKLDPGCMLTVTLGSASEPSIRRFWSAMDAASRGIAKRQTTSRDIEATADTMEALLRTTMRRCLVADVPVGVFLSGGIDSSVVAALAQAESKHPIRTFCVGFHETTYDEAGHAKAIAAHLGTDHTEFYVTPDDALALVPNLPTLWDEPFADSSQIPTHLVSRLAREHVTVALTGDGGDELFGGYNRYLAGANAWRRIKRLPRPMRAILSQAINSTPQNVLERLGRLAAPLLGAKDDEVRDGTYAEKARKLGQVLQIEDATGYHDRLISIWSDPDEIVLGRREEAEVAPDVDDDRLGDDPIDRFMLRDALTYLPDDILTKVDRAGMGTSLETRAPFLSHEVFEAAWGLPQQAKLHQGQGKRVLRHILARHIPRSLFERPKAGFGVPIDEWLRGPLKAWAEQLIDLDRLQKEGYLSPGPIQQAWREHQSGRRDRHHELWAVLMFQAWLEENAHLITDETSGDQKQAEVGPAA